MTTSRKKLHNRWHRELRDSWNGREMSYCEVRLPGCVGTFGLAPAHSRKRRMIENREQYFQVVAACQTCHRKLDEQMSHEEMETFVLEVIEKRTA